jgi:hypothetical protein
LSLFEIWSLLLSPFCQAHQVTVTPLKAEWPLSADITLPEEFSDLFPRWAKQVLGRWLAYWNFVRSRYLTRTAAKRASQGSVQLSRATHDLLVPIGD